MKVNQPAGRYDDAKSLTGKSKKIGEKKASHEISRDKVNSMDFTKQMDTATEDQLKRSLDELIEELAEQAKVLLQHRTFEELNKYSKLVKSFMEDAIKKIYSVKISDSSKLMIKRKKVYVIVERVNEELELLTKKILSANSDAIEILSALDKIRGMLVDMYS